MSYIDSTLITKEHVVRRARLHWLHFKSTITITVLGLLALAVHPAFAVIALTVAVIAAAIEWLEWTTFELALTNKRLIGKRGVIRRHSIELSLRKVERIEVQQGLLARLLGFGHVVVHGASDGGLVFPNIADPVGFRQAISAGMYGGEVG